MPDDFDVPEWVSEPHSSPASVDDRPAVRRADLRRSEREREQLRRERRRSHGDVGRARADGRPGSGQASSSAPEARDAQWLTRAERRQRLEEERARAQHARRPAEAVEMVPPTRLAQSSPEIGHDLPLEPGSRRRRGVPAPRPSRVSFARRRAAAALALTTSLAVLLWSLWPSQDSSAPERGTADLTSAVAQRSDPTPAAEDLPTAIAKAPPTGAKTVPKSGSGSLTSLALPAIAAPTVNPNRTVRVGLKVESGSGVDAAQAATIISTTLGDERGWQTHDQVRFRAVSPAAVAAGDVDITIVLASPDLTDDLCAPLKTRGEVSCFNLRTVVLNARRWTEGVPGYGKDLAAYRQYMVNHEVGHGLYHGHVECPGKGTPAPIMLQQSKGLDGCRPNAWPTVR